MSLISAQEARENAEKFSLSADEMLTQVANSISANSKASNTEIMVGFLAKVVDQSELNFVEKSLKEKGNTVEILNGGKNVHIRINY